MANTVKLKRSSVSGKAPATTDLDLGELAINTNDGKLYLKKDNGTESVVEVGPVASVAGRTGAVALSTTDVTGLGTIASQNANTVAVTGGAIDGTPVGGTTPAAGTFTTLIGGKDQVNYGQLTGGATTNAIEFKALGSDANVSYAIRSQGIGAIDLAAGSKGVNISNGGTVTAITRTATGSNYTSIPSVAISAPTTAGGVQATATATMFANIPTIVSGGTGYTVGDTITISGGTFFTAAQFNVATVSAGVITSVTTVTGGSGYSVLPTNPVGVTGGTGTGATFNITNWGLSTSFTITNAGSGYVEQPTVTFSGGGGSGAAAYATVGGNTILKSVSSALSLQTDVGEVLRVVNNSGAVSNPSYLVILGGASSSVGIYSAGSGSNVGTNYNTKGTAAHSFSTNSTSINMQFQVSHTASAVNYVQVTGSATGANPAISVQGSDATRGMQYFTKGSGAHLFFNNTGANTQFRIDGSYSAVNFLQVQGQVSGSAPNLSSVGSDTNIDLALTPKGTGVVQFGTLTATADTAISGYITIKDSGGTTRKLAVIT